MSQRTQMRLHAITGSLSAIHNESLESAAAAPAAIGANNLLDILGEVAGSIKRIHGADSFTNQAAGVFTHATASFSGKLDVAGMLDVNGAFDAAGAANLQSSLTVAGAADFKGDLIVTGAIKSEDLTPGRVVFVGASGELVDHADLSYSAAVLTVSGSTFGKDVSIVQDLSVGRNLVVTGDLTINGTTTTVNSTVVSVDDKAIELGATASPSDITANGGGIILKGSTDKTILWSSGSGAWEMNDDLLPSADNSYDLGADAKRWQDLYLEGAADIDGNADVAGTLAIGGAATFASVVTASAGIKIDGDTATRLYIVDADGSMKDEAKLRFDGSELLVDAHLEVSGAADLKSILWVSGAADFLSTMDIVGAVQMDSTLSVDDQATFSAAINLDQAADQSILKTGGDLYMSASADLRLQAGGDVKLADQYRAASTWSDAEGIKLAASAAEWSNFKATFGGEVSLLAALTGGGSGGKFKAEIAATSAFVTSSAMADVAGGADFASKWASIVEPKIAKVDVFVNGQLMVSGSGMDYNVASNGDITFGFDLVADDIVMALVR